MSTDLTPLQQDALCEIFNISVGRAAAAMSGLVGEEVSLSVPVMRFCSFAALHDRIGWSQWRHVDAVTQHFHGSFSGDAMLMFADDDGEEVVSLMLGCLPNRQSPASRLLIADALGEVGNVLLSACLSALAELIGEDFDYSVPNIASGAGNDVMVTARTDDSSQVLFLHVQFLLETRRIEGYLAFVMGVDSVDSLRSGVDRFLGNLGVVV